MITADDLNKAVTMVPTLPRVRFDANIGEAAEKWIKKKHLNPGDVHEPATLAVFIAAWQQGGIRHIYDVGALFGYFSLFSFGLFDNPQVTAFEMHPAIFESLCANLENHARCVEAVISDECEQDREIWISGFNIYEKPEGGWDRLDEIPGAMKQRGKDNRGRGFAKVDFLTLDKWCETNVPPDLIKIDVEGYQAKAIRGGMRTFTEDKPIVIIELHDPEKLARFGTTNRDTVQPLFDLGYKGFWCRNFRDKDARFEQVEQMDNWHEKLSLMVFTP